METEHEEAGQGHVGQGCTTTATEPIDISTEHDVSCLDNLPTGQHTVGYGHQYPIEGASETYETKHSALELTAGPRSPAAVKREATAHRKRRAAAKTME